MGKRFHIGDLLSVTTGRLLCPDGVDGLYRVLDFLTGDSLYTHQLPSAAEAVRPAILERFPFLADVTMPGSIRDADSVRRWVAEQAAVHGEWHEVTSCPGRWGRHDAIGDLVEMFGADRVIAVVVPGDGAS